MQLPTRFHKHSNYLLSGQDSLHAKLLNVAPCSHSMQGTNTDGDVAATYVPQSIFYRTIIRSEAQGARLASVLEQ